MLVRYYTMTENESSDISFNTQASEGKNSYDSVPDLVTLAKIAEDAVQRVGDLLASRHGDQSRNMKNTHGVAIDYATETDIIAERMLREALAVTKIPVHGEEENGADPLNGWCWVVDPIDGTLNWANNLPLCAISVGLCKNGVPKLGVILTPALRRRMSIGIVGLGAWVDGEPIVVSSVTPKEAVVAYDGFRDIGKDISGKVRSVIGRYRLIGSTATEMALCANGGFGAVISPEAMFWDVAAGIALIQAAGGVIVDLSGNPHKPGSGSVIAGSGQVVAAIVEALGGDRSYADQADREQGHLRKLGSPISHLTKFNPSNNVSQEPSQIVDRGEGCTQRGNNQPHTHQPHTHQPHTHQPHTHHSETNLVFSCSRQPSNPTQERDCAILIVSQYDSDKFRIDSKWDAREIDNGTNSEDQCYGLIHGQRFEERESCCKCQSQMSRAGSCCQRDSIQSRCCNE